MKRSIILLLLAVIAAALHWMLLSSSWGRKVEYFALDLWYNIQGPSGAPDDTVIVAMDEASYFQLGIPLNKAWPRELHAELLKILKDYGVKRVVFDVLFLSSGGDEKIDKDLAAAFSMVPTVLGAESAVRDVSSASGSYKLEELLLPYDPFLRNAKCAGLVGLPEDFGHVRRFLTERSSAAKDMPTLSEAAAGFCGRDRQRPGERDLIRFYGLPGSIPAYSYYQVLDREKPLPRVLLKDKVVVVGLMLRTYIGPSQKDIFLTPYFGAPRMFGTEIHATATNNLIHQDWIRRASPASEALWLGGASLILIFLLFWFKPMWGALLCGCALCVWSAAAYFEFTRGFFIPGALLFWIMLPAVLLFSTLYYYFITKRSHQKIEEAFKHYVSPEMASRAARNKTILGGEKVWATALFTDIENFTALTEDMPAERAAGMLNEYFSQVMEVVFENRGTLLKFIGDGAFIIWGAPVAIDNHAELACKTALEIQREVKRFNDSGRYPALGTRIGINTGPMVVGNLGSKRRFDYTAIGDAVNLASRVEGLNKYFGTEIIVTESVKKELGGEFDLLSLGTVSVLGKKEVQTVYCISSNPLDSALIEKWQDGLACFRERRWDKGRKIFIELSQTDFKQAAAFYLSQIDRFFTYPPASDWRGELYFQFK